MRVVIADPPAYTPPYDYALAAALVRQGVDVRLLTSPFRFGAVPRGRGIRGRRQPLPRLDADRRARHGRLAVKALEHPLALARLGARRLRPAPPAVGRGPGGRRAVAPHAPPARLHRPRPAAAPDGAPHEDLEAALRPLRPDRHPQRARPPDARGVRRRRRRSCGSSPIPPSAAIRPGTTTAARCSRSA